MRLLDDWLSRQCPGTGPLAERVRCEQLQRLRRTLLHAARSRFYRQRLAGLALPDSLEELPSLPFTHAEDIADWGDLLCVSQGDVARRVSLPLPFGLSFNPKSPVFSPETITPAVQELAAAQTSGTTGRPKRLAFTDADLERTRDFFAVGMSQLVHAGESVLVLLPGAERPHGVTDLLRQGLARIGVRVVAGKPQATPESLREDLRQRPQCVVAAPAQLEQLAALYETERHTPLHALSSAEPLPPALASRLRGVLGGEILDHYGLTESGYGCGVECSAHHGYHLRELDCLVEIVDIHTGEPLPEGHVGEIVLTTPGREAMPLIRYRTGDAASLLPGPCRCGSPLRRLGPILGRIVREGPSVSILPLQKGGWHVRNPSF